MASNGPVEPMADLRQWAAMMYQMFVSLCQAGFTEEQAALMTQAYLHAALLGDKLNPGN